MHIVHLNCPHVHTAFLKFPSCDNQGLVGCIPISAVAVPKICHLTQKMYSNNIPNFQESTTILNACKQKSGNLLNASRTSSDDTNASLYSNTWYGLHDSMYFNIIYQCIFDVYVTIKVTKSSCSFICVLLCNSPIYTWVSIFLQWYEYEYACKYISVYVYFSM